jgi:hypothetical protein
VTEWSGITARRQGSDPRPDQIRHGVEDLVHRAATAARPHVTDFDRVRRRAALRRRRRTAFTAGGAAALAAVLVLVPSTFLTRPAPRSNIAVPIAPATSTATAPAQRLILPGRGWTGSVEGRPTVGVAGVDGIVEVHADGRFDVLPGPPGLDQLHHMEALVDGGLVVLGSRDLMPGVERDDGPMVEGVEFPLIVTRADGAVVSRRDVRIQGEHVALLGVADGVAYLARKAGVVAHNLDTGAERLVVPLTEEFFHGDQAGSTVVLLTQGELVVVDLVAGRQTGRFAVPGRHGNVRLSPDGRSVAVVSMQSRNEIDEIVEIRDVGTGKVSTVRQLRSNIPMWTSDATGLAWTDADTVRAAWLEPPRDADRIYPLSEALHTAQIRRP